MTRTLTSLDWAGSQILDGDVTESVNDLKSQGDGFITVLGSGVLVQTLIDHALIDHYRPFVHPLVLGTGKRLFRETLASATDATGRLGCDQHRHPDAHLRGRRGYVIAS